MDYLTLRVFLNDLRRRISESISNSTEADSNRDSKVYARDSLAWRNLMEGVENSVGKMVRKNLCRRCNTINYY